MDYIPKLDITMAVCSLVVVLKFSNLDLFLLLFSLVILKKVFKYVPEGSLH